MGALNIFVTHTIYCCIIKLDECIKLTGSDAKIIDNLENNMFNLDAGTDGPIDYLRIKIKNFNKLYSLPQPKIISKLSKC